MTNRQPLRPHPHLYEINTWVWLEALSRREGRAITLGQVPEPEWDDLQAKGFDLVWLMGVWRRSPESRRIAQTDPELFPAYEAALAGWRPEDVVGSPYAVQAYEPDPRVGTWDELDGVRATLHQRGMRLVLDFVPNHTARDHAWIATQPEYYIQGDERSLSERSADFFLPPGEGPRRPVAHGRDPYFPPWSDSAQLNYLNPATRTAMIGELHRIAQHCDGIRCDMAMLELNRVFTGIWGGLAGDRTPPPREFWAEAREAVPALLLIAEAYWDLEWELQQLGFDFTYDKRLYDRLREGRAGDLTAHLAAGYGYQSRLVRFLENHDEPRSAAAFGGERLTAAATVVATLPGMRLYHQGQLEGRRRRLPVQLATAPEEPADPACVRLYETLLRLTDDEGFHGGHWRLLVVWEAGDQTSEHILAYEWRSPTSWKIVAVNLSASASRGRLELKEAAGDAGAAPAAFRTVDALTQTALRLVPAGESAGGVLLELAPYQARILALRG